MRARACYGVGWLRAKGKRPSTGFPFAVNGLRANRRALLRGPSVVRWRWAASHSLVHILEYFVPGDGPIPVPVKVVEVSFLGGHPLLLTDPAVAVRIHVLEHHIDGLFHPGIGSRVPARAALARRRLCLREHAAAEDKNRKAREYRDHFPVCHLFLPFFTAFPN